MTVEGKELHHSCVYPQKFLRQTSKGKSNSYPPKQSSASRKETSQQIADIFTHPDIKKKSFLLSWKKRQSSVLISQAQGVDIERGAVNLAKDKKCPFIAVFNMHSWILYEHKCPCWLMECTFPFKARQEFKHTLAGLWRSTMSDFPEEQSTGEWLYWEPIKNLAAKLPKSYTSLSVKVLDLIPKSPGRPVTTEELSRNLRCGMGERTAWTFDGIAFLHLHLVAPEQGQSLFFHLCWWGCNWELL